MEDKPICFETSGRKQLLNNKLAALLPSKVLKTNLMIKLAKRTGDFKKERNEYGLCAASNTILILNRQPKYFSYLG